LRSARQDRGRQIGRRQLLRLCGRPRLRRRWQPSAGDREIKTDEAEIVHCIFQEFATGKSPRAIAHALNKERIPGPRGEGRGQSTINGNPERDTGILSNELYIGRLVWNRLRYVKDPSTGKRVSRPNPPESWAIREVPHLRIVDDELWQAVKAQQHRASEKSTRQMANNASEDQATGFWSHQRPRYLLSGLMRCGACGGGYTKISANLFGCASARNKGTCDNRLNIRTEALEDIVCTGLKARLMDPEIFKGFAAAFIAERNTILAQQNAHFAAAKTELVQIKSRQKTLVKTLGDGVPARLGERRAVLLGHVGDRHHSAYLRPARRCHPATAALWRDERASTGDCPKGRGDIYRVAAITGFRLVQ
jgi:site-specific DNA recombinase